MIHTRFKAITVMAVAAATAIGLSGCSSSGGTDPADGKATLTYALWDTSQQPAYQACATAFTKKTGIKVKVQQTDYNNYFTGLSTDFVSGSGPDVFANVTSNYPDYAQQQQIVDITPLIEKDKIDLSAYQPVTLQNWKMDGKYYGLPKDIDAVGLAYDSKVIEAADVDPASLNELTWNADDGGTFGTLVKKLTVDSAGHNGLDPAFDKSKVARYGLVAPNVSDITGHTSWGNFVLSSGSELLSPNPFGTKWNFASGAVPSTVTWYQKMIAQGFIQKPSLNNSLSTSSLFDAGKIALATEGTWNAGVFSQGKASVKWARFPAGPDGERVYTNSLADSINANSKNQDEAWEWVKYLGSSACQDTVASYGVVFPALKDSTAKALAAYTKNGVDLQPILDVLQAPGQTVALPVSLKFAQVSQAGNAALQAVWLNNANVPSTLGGLNEQVNALYK